MKNQSRQIQKPISKFSFVALVAGITVFYGYSGINPVSAATLAIIETSDEGTPKGSNIGIKGDLNKRLKGEFDFGGLKPPVPPTFSELPAKPPRTPNSHSTDVANIAIQDNMADVFFGGLGTTGTGTEPIYNAFRSATDWLYRNKGVGLFNLSDWIEGDPDYPNKQYSGINDNGANNSAQFIDWFSQTRDVLLIKSAGNNGKALTITAKNQISNPGDAYNVITVGASDKDHKRVESSSYWLEGDNENNPDVRGKPDILAPGDATSYAAPRVTAASALLWEKGLVLGTQGKHNHLAQKAIILNSADKRRINPPRRRNSEADTSRKVAGQTLV